jgi:tetratricopeptide (TPR) repeat protein
VKTQSHILDLEDRIDLYVKGALSQPQIDDLWVDVIQNNYLDYMKTAATIRKLSVGRKVTPIPLFQGDRTRRFTAAAAAAVVIGIGTSLYFLSGTETAPGFLPLSKIEYSLLRSTETTNEAFESQLEAITVMALQGERQMAETELNLLLNGEITPIQRSSAMLSLAALRYNEGEYESALIDFDTILGMESTGTMHREKAAWYSANALIHLNRTAEAEPYLQQVIQLDGVYKRAALTASDQLRRR